VTGAAARGAAALVASLGPESPLAVAVFDAELRCRAASPSVLALGGRPAGEWPGREAAALVPTIAGPVVAALTAVRDGVDTVRRLPEVTPDDASEPIFRIACLPLAAPGPPLVALLAADVTARALAQRRVQENRERLEMAERLALLGAWTWWPADGNRWRWSEQLLRLAGFEGEDHAPPYAVWLGMVDPEDRHEAMRVRSEALAGRRGEFSVRQSRPDGTQRVLRVMAVPSVDDDAVTRVDGVVQDVTEAARTTAQQQAVAELGQAALEGVGVDALIERACAALVHALGFEEVAVLESAADGTLRMRTAHGRAARHGVVAVGRDSLAGRALRNGEAVLVDDWEHERRFPKPALLHDAPLGSSAAVVVRGPSRPWGVIAGHHARPQAVTSEDVVFLGAIANVLGSAIARLALETELTEHATARGRLIAAALDAEDRTRREISETLHDGPLQDLLALNQFIARLEPDDDRTAMHLARARRGLGTAIAGLREVMLELHPVVLDVGGLDSALGAIAAQQGQLGGFAADVRIEPASRGVRDELVLSLARELLVNAAKHAAASRVEVSVRRTRTDVVLEVADDGRGIADGRLQAALREGHIGLASSRQRVEAVGGRLELTAGAGTGTRVTAVLPAAT
jgi:signal transduction histidine kinase/PAS domain-containing protein